MYRRWSGHCPIGGKMLKILFVLFISLPLFACTGVNVDGKLAVDGQSWKLNQNFTLDREQSIPLGPYILSMTVSHSGNIYKAKYKVEEKKAGKLVLVTAGEEDEIDLSKSRDIMAKGEEGQPHSIITLKLNHL